jgi:hypothetical protein
MRRAAKAGMLPGRACRLPAAQFQPAHQCINPRMHPRTHPRTRVSAYTSAAHLLPVHCSLRTPQCTLRAPDQVHHTPAHSSWAGPCCA